MSGEWKFVWVSYLLTWGTLVFYALYLQRRSRAVADALDADRKLEERPS